MILAGTPLRCISIMASSLYLARYSCGVCFCARAALATNSMASIGYVLMFLIDTESESNAMFIGVEATFIHLSTSLVMNCIGKRLI